MNDLTDPAGIAALSAGGVALLALLLALVLAVRMRRLRSAQRLVLGEQGATDLVAHAASLQQAFGALHVPVAHGGHRVVDAGQRHGLDVGRSVAGQHRLLAVGPGRAEEADLHPCSVAALSPASARRTASASSGESSSSPRPSTTCLQ